MSRVISFKTTETLIQELDEIVDDHPDYRNRSHAIEIAVTEFVDRHNKSKSLKFDYKDVRIEIEEEDILSVRLDLEDEIWDNLEQIENNTEQVFAAFEAIVRDIFEGDRLPDNANVEEWKKFIGTRTYDPLKWGDEKDYNQRYRFIRRSYYF